MEQVGFAYSTLRKDKTQGGLVMKAVSEKTRGKGIKFERIRRITGYLTGDINTWNGGKRAELKDRVKHA